MKKLIILFFIHFLVFKADAQSQTFKADSTNSFYISYPELWELEENTKPGVLLQLMEPNEDSKDLFQENFSVVLEKFLENNYSLKKYSEEAETTFLKYLTKPDVYQRESITIDGKEGNRIFIDAKIGKYKLSFVQYFIVFDRQAYIITFSFEVKKKTKYLPLLDEIMKTFRFK